MWSQAELAYCSNVHPGETVDLLEHNITTYVRGVRERRGLPHMSAGLWLSQSIVDAYLQNPATLEHFRVILQDSGIVLTTLNGFPYGGFHSEVVKSKVYRPDWSESSRLSYTLDLATLLARCMPDDCVIGTLSTVPLGFTPEWSQQHQQMAIDQLCCLVDKLEDLDQRSGKQILVCLEMEPGCVLETTEQLIDFFNVQLLEAAEARQIPLSRVKRYLGICYDVCHQAVMFEQVFDSLESIYRADISIGKIQISSALRVDNPAVEEVQSLLRHFAEPRYLHQVRSLDPEGKLIGMMDLIDALNTRFSPTQPWRIHFHVPIHAKNLYSRHLKTTSDAIDEACRFLSSHPELKPHIEVETYTWQVLPGEQQPKNDDELIQGLTAELNYLENSLLHYGLLGDSTAHG